MNCINFSCLSCSCFTSCLCLPLSLLNAFTWQYVKPFFFVEIKRLKITKTTDAFGSNEDKLIEILRKRGGERWLRLPRARRTTGSCGRGGGQEREGWWGRDFYSPLSFVIISGVIAGWAALEAMARRRCWHHPPPGGLQGCVTTFATRTVLSSICQRDACSAQVQFHPWPELYPTPNSTLHWR